MKATVQPYYKTVTWKYMYNTLTSPSTKSTTMLKWCPDLTGLGGVKFMLMSMLRIQHFIHTLDKWQFLYKVGYLGVISKIMIVLPYIYNICFHYLHHRCGVKDYIIIHVCYNVIYPHSTLLDSLHTDWLYFHCFN